MAKLLVIADDFTGALDTGVQFQGEETLIYRVKDGEICDFDKLKVQVLIIDAETRHMSPEQAYNTIFKIVEKAKEAGISCIYKKTDSALRGNIGSELSAVLSASECERLHFIPALPAFGRITKKGIHYIDGCPVAESIFGTDPYEPVKYSSVQDIIGCQSDIETHLVGDGILEQRGVLIYDAVTNDDILKIALELEKCDELHVMAGCAGFASVLPPILGLKQGGNCIPKIKEDLLLVCGSINPITIKQMDEAEREGATKISLTLEQKLETDWLDSPDSDQIIEQWKQRIEESSCAILESATSLEAETVQEYADRRGLSKEDVRVRISNTMAAILQKLISSGLKRTLMITGGDTLLAFMDKIEVNELSPIGELFPGVVLSQIQYKGQFFYLVSKSGGFGDNRLLIDLENIIKNSKKQEEL